MNRNVSVFVCVYTLCFWYHITLRKVLNRIEWHATELCSMWNVVFHSPKTIHTPKWSSSILVWVNVDICGWQTERPIYKKWWDEKRLCDKWSIELWFLFILFFLLNLITDERHLFFKSESKRKKQRERKGELDNKKKQLFHFFLFIFMGISVVGTNTNVYRELIICVPLDIPTRLLIFQQQQHQN